MQNAKTGSFCLQITNWVKIVLVWRMAVVVEPLTTCLTVGMWNIFYNKKTDGGQIRSQSYERDW